MALLKDKVILITGAGSGIGRACAVRAAAEGAKVVATDINEESAKQTADIIAQAGGEAFSMRHDATSEADWEKAVKETLSRYGGMHGLVNNAGGGGAIDAGKPSEMTIEGLRYAMTLNLETAAIGTRLGLLHMKDKGGAIVNLASVAGSIGEGVITAYSCAKTSVIMLTKMAAQEALESGWPVRANSICPGFINTPLLRGAIDGGLSESVLGNRLKAIPKEGQIGEPEVIADTAVYLLSDLSRFVTGEEIQVDGGLHAM